MMPFKRNIFTCFLFIPAALLLISGIGRDDVPLEQYYAKAQDSAFRCVGELYVKGKFANTCVLIHERYVLTTAHSIFLDSKKNVKDSIETPVGKRTVKRPAYTYPAQPQELVIQFDNQKVKAKGIIIHPQYSDSFRRSTDAYDLVLIELETPVTGIAIPELYTGQLLNKPGIAVGCGAVATADDYKEKKNHKRRKMAGENMIDSVNGPLLWADMDHPRLSGFNRMGSEKPLPLEWLGNGGDCGSALFIEENNQKYLAGISFSPAYFTDMYHYGKLKGVSYGFVTGWASIPALHDWIVYFLPVASHHDPHSGK